MAFVLKQKDITNPNKTANKEFTHDSGLTVTFKSFLNPSFQKAYALITSKIHSDNNQELTIDTLSKQAFNDDSLTYDEALIIAIGEHLIVDWDLIDEKGDKLAVTGQNLMLLLNQIDNPSEFIQWCMDCTSKVAKSIAEDLAVTKKKSSSATNGKKTTQA